MKTVRGLPMVTVEQCIRYHETALEIEAQRDKLLAGLRNCAAALEHRDKNAFEARSARAIIAEIEADK
jgi:hypothetical protein